MRPCPSCEGDHLRYDARHSDCPHPTEYHSGTRKRDGNYLMYAFCIDCNALLHGVKKIHSRYEDVALNHDHFVTDANPPCARCGSPDTQEHHWAPRHLFGFDDAETWPKSYLCRACHALWHSTVTPRMGTTGRRGA